MPDAKHTSAEAAPPELVEVRVLVVAYKGASGAPATLARGKPEALERANMIARMARSGDRLAELVAGAEQVLVTAAVAADVPEKLAGVRYQVAGGDVRRDD